MNLEIGIYMGENFMWRPYFNSCSKVYDFGWLCFDFRFYLDDRWG